MNYIKRTYESPQRAASAERTRAKVLDAGKFLFSRKGIDSTTIAQIAERAGVSSATVYATVKSKSGLLHALITEAIFGPPFQRAQAQLADVTDPVERVVMSARVARAIYESESAELSLLMKASAFSPELRKSLQGFESTRRQMQRERIDGLFRAGRAKKGLDAETASDILWALTGRDIYYKLVHESGWTPDKFEQWLAFTIRATLTDTK